MIRFLGRGAALVAVIAAFVAGAAFSALDPAIVLGLFAQNRGDVGIALLVSLIIATISEFTVFFALRR